MTLYHRITIEVSLEGYWPEERIKEKNLENVSADLEMAISDLADEHPIHRIEGVKVEVST